MKISKLNPNLAEIKPYMIEVTKNKNLRFAPPTPINILVTTPKSEMEISAEEAEICKKNGGGWYHRKLGRNRPKDVISGISKIYYVEDGFIRGYGVISAMVNVGDIKNTQDIKEEICEFTGRNWGTGWFAHLKADSWHWIEPIPYKGFQGWRYFDDSKVKVVGGWMDPKPPCK